MTPDALRKLKTLLIEHEGMELFPYEDTTGNLTIGVGRNLKANGIRASEAMAMLNNDIEFFSDALPKSLPFFNELDEARKIALIDMCFNLGLNGFLQFKNMLGAIQHKDWEMASYHIIKSKAYTQAPRRYKRLANIMRTGVLNG